MADFVIEIIFALEMGGFESIKENNCKKKKQKKNKIYVMCTDQCYTMPQHKLHKRHHKGVEV